MSEGCQIVGILLWLACSSSVLRQRHWCCCWIYPYTSHRTRLWYWRLSQPPGPAPSQCSLREPVGDCCWAEHATIVKSAMPAGNMAFIPIPLWANLGMLLHPWGKSRSYTTVTSLNPASRLPPAVRAGLGLGRESPSEPGTKRMICTTRGVQPRDHGLEISPIVPFKNVIVIGVMRAGVMAGSW